MRPRCVIIIPFVTLNGYVVECIERCLELDYDNFQLALLPDVPVELPSNIPTERITVIVTGSGTIAAKRNAGIAHFADASYVALIDSDAYPENGWLATAVRFLEGHPEVWAVGGPNVTPPGEPLMQRVVGNAHRSFLVSGPLYFAKQRSPSRFCTSLHSCNLILRQEVFTSIGGFDESLFTGEDRNLCDRIGASGHAVYFHRDVVVYHHNRRLWKQFFLQRLTYGHGSAGISRRCCNRFNLLLYLPVAWAALLTLVIVVPLVAGGSVLPGIGLVALGLTVILVEAVRTSGTVREIPFTLAAILVCYAGTTLGLLLALTGLTPDLKRIYVNHTQ